MKNLSRKEAITILESMKVDIPVPKAAVTQIKRNLALDMAINTLNCSEIPNNSDTISRQAAIDAFGLSEKTRKYGGDHSGYDTRMLYEIQDVLEGLPSVQPERKWIPCSNPPKHHKDVIVRGIEAIGNVTVHKVMQWDVDTWRPTDYAPSVMWKEWSEI